MTLHPELHVRKPAAQTLRAVVLLAGHVGKSRLLAGAGRPALDLPVDRERSILDLWAERFSEFAAQERMSRLLVRVAIDQNGPEPRVPDPATCPGVDFEIVRDFASYRGTAGVVKDVTAEFEPDDRILVATAGQIIREPLTEILAGLRGTDEGVTIVPNGITESASAFVLKRSRLAGVPHVGFVDLKEQAIPAATGEAPLRVSRRAAGSALPVRTRSEYIAAVRALHVPHDEPSRPDPFAEVWSAAFSIVEEDAVVSPEATLQDAVVLTGAVVEAGAVVARSVVCPGAVVRRGQVAIETVVTAEDVR